jgi:hypothetical protein
MGVKIKRFSLKNRNSNNYPTQFEKEYLNYFEELNSGNELTPDSYLFKATGSNDQNNVTLIKPIIIGAPCLNCHGSKDQINSDVRLMINEKYPDDKATGYNIGDLRGAISITKAL